MYKKLLVISLILLVVLASQVNFTSLGQAPDKPRIQIYRTLPNYKNGIFINRRPEVINDQHAKIDMMRVIKEYLAQDQGFPDKKLPEAPIAWDKFANPEKINFVWLGHSTIFLNMFGTTILFDPIIQNASPVSFLAKRYQPFMVNLDDFPSIDHVIISHDHYDHLDYEAIKALKDKAKFFHTPHGVDSHLEYWGVDVADINPYNWWDTKKFSADDEETDDDEVTIVCTPSQHFSGRVTPSDNNTLWASWLISKNGKKVYFSGDSGYDIHFRQIGEKYGPIDLAFMETGQYGDQWSTVHLMPDQMPQAFSDLQAEVYVPIHWGMYQLALHSWFDPIEQIYKRSQEKGFPLLTPKLGEVLTPEDTTEIWWR